MLKLKKSLLEVFHLIAERAVAEYRRLAAERRLQASEEQLARLLDGAMDAILVLDSSLAVNRANPAAERLFRRGRLPACSRWR